MVAQPFEWRMPVDVCFGAGCSDGVPAVLCGRPAVVLAFEAAAGLGLKARWQAALGEQLLDWVSVPDGLSSLALARSMSARVWAPLARSLGGVLVAIGGGSTMDLAKLLRCRPADGDPAGIAAAVRGLAPWPAMQIDPLWLVPTTAGTGSEVTRWATVWDTDSEPGRKRSLDESWGYAERAFVDPVLTLSCPPAVTRDTALDTLAHALESLWNRHANPFSDRFAVQAARRVLANLAGVLGRPQDLALRTQLSLAALEAGLAFSQTRTALAHALSYDVTLSLGVPHGLACALWLPTAWRLAVGHSQQVDDSLSEVFGTSAAEGAGRLVEWLHGVGVDALPLAYGIDDADARILNALNSPRGRNFVGSPS
jgi:phosphonate metabolism-associated iron-containing alcohol dehydrogenase